MVSIVDIQIKDYLNEIGIQTRKEGNKYFASSPFSRDSNWSFCIYPTNTFFDFSSGHGGNIINLVATLDGITKQEAARKLKEGLKYEKYKPSYKCEEQQRPPKPFNYEKYINTDPEECKQIQEYAASRGITEGYFCGVFFTRRNDSRGSTGDNELPSGRGNRLEKWIRVPALGFLHIDKDLKPCGAKFRRLDKQEPRFSARGELGLYLLQKLNTETITGGDALYVVEGEANANSLWSFLKKTSNVLSIGGVASALKCLELPQNLKGLNTKLIIDYDGNEELYQQRLALYKGLGAEPIKLILPKGQDINSLYVQNKMWVIEKLLL